MLNEIQMAKFEKVEGEVRSKVREMVNISYEINKYLDEILFNGEAYGDELTEIATLIQTIALEEGSKMLDVELDELLDEVKENLEEGLKRLN